MLGVVGEHDDYPIECLGEQAQVQSPSSSFSFRILPVDALIIISMIYMRWMVVSPMLYGRPGGMYDALPVCSSVWERFSARSFIVSSFAMLLYVQSTVDA
eukprot:scaffold108810_cov25-Prasinocladus_malaysianus.AAC.1